ncbi:MAG: UDP-N-acetylglucosamine 2-epimerase, partial [Deltaproteobacteria bacterium]|nr:UDP-N-acetylglucosamine 2-epimerase [Deltaproteobacteria bacterium]
GVLERLGVEPDGYLLLTLHRPANVDDPETLRRILEALRRCGEPVVFPVHPRTRRAIEAAGLAAWLGTWREARVTEPLGFLDFLALERAARKIVTDSGGGSAGGLPPGPALRDRVRHHPVGRDRRARMELGRGHRP